MTRPSWGALTVALVLSTACRRSPTASTSAASGEGDARAADPLQGTAPATVPARCAPTDRSSVLLDPGSSDVDLGDAVAFGGALAVAMVRTTATGRIASVALVPLEEGARNVRVVDLGAALGDAPPPRLVMRGGELLSGYHGAIRSGSESRPFVIHSISAEGTGSPLFTVDEQRDDSLASDFASSVDRGIVVWDEATREPRGVIRAQAFAGRQRVGAPVDVSPKDSDAELPRVVRLGHGYAVSWIARGPENASGASDGSDFEVTGEPRARGWLEMAQLDENGAVVSAVRRLTLPTGHVSTYDVRSLAAGASPAALLFVARDDGEAVDGSGGTLLRIRVTGDVAEPPLAYATDGLGRGAPSLVDGDPGWLAWVAGSEQMRLLPLDGSGAPQGAPSAEDRLDDARPLMATDGGHLLVATPGDPTSQLRTFACSR